MRTGALVVGIIGGLFALFYGLLGFGLGSLAEAGEPGSGVGLQIVSIIIPVVALIGAGIIKTKPTIGSSLVGLSAIILILILGFNFFSMVPVILLGISALLGFIDSQDDTD